MTTTPEQWLQLARDAFSASNTYFDASIRNQIETDLRQAQGMHPSGSKYHADAYKGRSRLFRPKTRSTIRKNEAVAAEAFFSTNDVVSVKPEGVGDDVTRASADVMQAILQFRLTKSIPWFHTLIGAYQDAMTVGVVASYQHWQYNEAKGIDRPAIRLIPIENIRFDPAADWTDPVNTSPYVIEMIPMYVKDVRARMKSVDTKTGEAKWMQLDEARLLTAVRSYGDSTRSVRERNRTDSKTETHAITAFSVVWVHKNIIEQDGIDYVYYTLGDRDLLSKPIELSKVIAHGKRPYVIGSCIIETHKNYPSSLPSLSKDVQAEINEIANQRIDNVKYVLNKRYFAKRNAQVDLRSLMRNAPGSVTLMNNPREDVIAQEFQDVTGSSYQEQDRLNLDFDEITGSFSNSSVQSNRSLNETVGGLQLISGGSNQMAGYQLRTFVESWVEPVLRQIVLLEQFYETDEVLLALAAEAAKISADLVTDDLLMKELTVTVNVGMGATNPTEQANKFLMAMTALQTMLADGTLVKYGLDIKEVITELFGKVGYKDGGRFFDMENQDPTVTGMRSEIDALQQQLAQKTSPELVQAQIAKLNAEVEKAQATIADISAGTVLKLVDASKGAMEAGEIIAAVPQIAPIADAVMQAAGYVAPAAGVDPNFPQPAMAALPAPVDPAMPEPMPEPVPGFANGGLIGAQRDNIFAQQRQSFVDRQNAQLFDQSQQEIDNNAAEVANTVETGLALRQQSDAEEGQALIQQATQQLGVTPQTGPVQVQGDSAIGQQLSKAVGLLGIEAPAVPTAPKPPSAFNSGLSTKPTFESGLQFGGAFADGGQIQGPGTGTSDSIPAVVDGQELIAVSNDEYRIPRAVVEAMGIDFFENIVARHHKAAPQGNPQMADVPPLEIDSGDFIMPADCVAIFGREFFDNLVTKFGGMQ